MTEWNEWRKANPEEPILLVKVYLFDSNLGGANLEGATLLDADLGGANLFRANLFRANLMGATLIEATLVKAYLIESKLKGAYLRWAKIAGANLFRANLEGASLFEANLRDANLEGANLKRANLKGAILQGANLRKTDLDQVNVHLVKFDSRTQCSNLKGKDFYGSPVFKSFVEDCDYLEDFKVRHPVVYGFWLISSNCGRSITLWAAWSLCLAVFFANAFYKLGPEAIEVSKLPWNFSSLVYYSVVTFTTLGFGDVTPKTNAAAWFVMAEVIIGYVMLGGLISIFANKLARRS